MFFDTPAQPVITPAQQDITELLARLEAAEADAARYRWLRHGENDEIIIAYADDPDPFSLLPRSDKLDAAIDAARAKEAA